MSTVTHAVTKAALVDRALERSEQHTFGIRGAIAFCRKRAGALRDAFLKPSRRRDVVDQPPGFCAIGAHALGGGAEHIGEVAPDLALVDQPGQTAGAGQDAEQRHLGKADRARPVVDHDDLVAGERQLVAAAGAGAVDRGDEFETRMRARILDPVARLVGKFAEIDLCGVARLAEHVDVGAGAEDPLLAARQDHDAHLGVLETDAVQRVVQLDIDAEIVGIELEPVAGEKPAIFGDIKCQGGDRAVTGEPPVAIARGIGVERDHRAYSISFRHFVMPAQAGIQRLQDVSAALDPRFRGGDGS